MDFPAPEDEVIGLEHLLEEPRYNDLVDCVLGFGTFNLQKCFNIEKLTNVEYGCIKTDADTMQSSLIHGEKTKNEFLGRKFEETSDGTNDLPERCEDYLLDTEFDDSVSDFNCVPSEGSCKENLGSDYLPATSGDRQNGADVVELSTTSIPILEATSDQKSSLLDEMTIDELHEAFKTMFGRETAVTDKLWLKQRITFGLQNLDASNSGLSLSDFRLTSNENEGKMGFSTSGESCRESSPLTGVFNFKTKPRGRFAKRGRRTYSDSLRTLSFEDNKVVFGSQDLGENVSVFFPRRSRRPTQKYIEHSLQQTSRFQRRKCGVSDTFSKDKVLRIGSARQQKGSRQTPLGHGKELFEGACIQVPFGNPVEKGSLKKKVHESENCKDKRLRGSYVESDVELCTAKSEDDTSEDDCVTKTLTYNGKSRRKHHTLWSLPEVLRLVDGVSKYGVGRWTEIKKVLFPAHAHRTSVDLKDKWRNLLRASCTMRSQSKRGFWQVEQKRKHGSHPVPQHILRRVRELAAMYPYPRERRIKVPRAVAIASPVSASTCDNLLPFSTAVRA